VGLRVGVIKCNFTERINQTKVIIMSNQSIKGKLHTVRMVASFALLGAVATGVLFGWADVDLRPIGAAIGAGVAVVYKISHLC